MNDNWLLGTSGLLFFFIHVFHFEFFILDGIRFLTLFKHEPNFSNELKIEPGDIVIGIEKDMNGWMKGKREKSGEIGMFPAIYVEEITQVFMRR